LAAIDILNVDVDIPIEVVFKKRVQDNLDSIKTDNIFDVHRRPDL